MISAVIAQLSPSHMKPRTAKSKREASAKVALGRSLSISSVTLEPIAVAKAFKGAPFGGISMSGSGTGCHMPGTGYPGYPVGYPAAYPAGYPAGYPGTYCGVYCGYAIAGFCTTLGRGRGIHLLSPNRSLAGIASMQLVMGQCCVYQRIATCEPTVDVNPAKGRRVPPSHRHLAGKLIRGRKTNNGNI